MKHNVMLTLAVPRSARTRIEREFDPGAVRRLKADAEHDITVDGPELAAQAIRASLVDEFQMIVCPVVVGSGKRFFPDGVRLNVELVEERRFRKGVIVLRYAVRGGAGSQWSLTSLDRNTLGARLWNRNQTFVRSSTSED